MLASLTLLRALFLRVSAPLRALLACWPGGSGVSAPALPILLSLPPLRGSFPLPLKGARGAAPDTARLFPCEGRGPSPVLSPKEPRWAGTDASPINRGFGLLPRRSMMGPCLCRGTHHRLSARFCTVIGHAGCWALATPLYCCIRFTPRLKNRPETRRRPLNHPSGVSTAASRCPGLSGAPAMLRRVLPAPPAVRRRALLWRGA